MTLALISAQLFEMENWQFGEGARDVCDIVCSFLVRSFSPFFAYVELGRVFLILWREIVQCSPYQTGENLADFLTKTTSGAKCCKLVSGVVNDIYDDFQQ